MLSLAWSLTLWAYATLYGAKFSVLNSIEAALPVRPFTTQSQRLAAYLPITIVERFVALLITVPLLVMLRQTHPALTMVFAATDLGIVGWLAYDVRKWRNRSTRQPTTPSS